MLPAVIDLPPNQQRPERGRCCHAIEVFDSTTVLGFAASTQCGVSALPQRFLRQDDSAQSKRLETDSSAAVRLMASPIRVAIESTRILAATRTASLGWIVSVM